MARRWWVWLIRSEGEFTEISGAASEEEVADVKYVRCPFLF